MADKYDITEQAEIMDLAPDGAPVRSMSVQFRTKPNGIVASIRIPIAKYSPAEVARQVEDLASKLEETHTL